MMEVMEQYAGKLTNGQGTTFFFHRSIQKPLFTPTHRAVVVSTPLLAHQTNKKMLPL